jgi:hypothetical protein
LLAGLQLGFKRVLISARPTAIALISQRKYKSADRIGYVKDATTLIGITRCTKIKLGA